MNPWHDVDLGEEPTALFQCVIEIPRGSKCKYELDKETGLLRLDRILYSAVHYPASYGFLPRTYCDDGDPLDVLVLCQEPVVPLCLVRAIPIGVIGMVDEEGRDDKIVAVAADDPEFRDYRDVDELPEHRLRETRRFLMDYKQLEPSKVEVGELRGPDAAREVVRDAVRKYRETFGPGN